MGFLHSQFGILHVYECVHIHMEAHVSPRGCACVFVSKAEEGCKGG